MVRPEETWSPPPSSLYKYTRIGDDCFRILRESQIHYRAPREFNDPFDCRIRVTFEGTKQERRGRLISGLREHHPLLTTREVRLMAEKLLRHSTPDLWKQLESSAIEDLQANMGVVSLTAKRDDILMWAHYAGGHSGVCLQFDTQNQSPFQVAFPVEYHDKYPIFAHFGDGDDETRFKESILHKSTHWSYEEEWRLISYRFAPRQHGPGWLSFPPEALTGVILGCKIRKEDEMAVRQALVARPQPPRIFRAAPHPERYEVEIREIDLAP